ncbi:MAG TPA: poly(A) polymerase [Sphaerochaeta sp.]|nr:poly(A) polymerase [Sphaerochaeta sp.]HQB54009.1 poly(A) polymerase [Sphaerochaeta sp.]
MLIRYKQDDQGNTLPIANIYTQAEHKIETRNVDRDALRVIKKLQGSGAEAYLVGGAVRDLMLGNIPKDFDIATSASPRQVQRLFYNARVIGRRFKLVHLIFKDKVLEVSTFRSGEEAEDGSNNVFGSIEQDAKRRDFSINSFYYDPSNGQLLDFNNAMEDMKKKRISSVIPLDESFTEDPVRMIRAIKYAVITGFSLRFKIRIALRKYAPELSRISSSRLTEELTKILSSGHAAEIFAGLNRYKILSFMMPAFTIYCSYPQVKESIKGLDKQVQAVKANDGEEIEFAEMLKALVDPLIVFSDASMSPANRFKETFRQIKVLISPMTPSNYDVELTAMRILSERGFRTPRNAVRRPPQAQRRGGTSPKPRPTTQKRKRSPTKQRKEA